MVFIDDEIAADFKYISPQVKGLYNKIQFTIVS